MRGLIALVQLRSHFVVLLCPRGPSYWPDYCTSRAWLRRSGYPAPTQVGRGPCQFSFVSELGCCGAYELCRGVAHRGCPSFCGNRVILLDVVVSWPGGSLDRRGTLFTGPQTIRGSLEIGARLFPAFLKDLYTRTCDKAAG